MLHASYRGCCAAVCQNVQTDPCMQLTAWSLPACCLVTETLCTSSLNDKRCLPAIPCCVHRQPYPRSLTEVVPYFPYLPPCRAWSAWHLFCPQAILLLQAEAFPVHTANHLGPLTRLTVGYRPSFPGDRWHLNRVEVTDEGTGLLYIFFCSAWLGDDNTVVIHLQV